MDRIDEAEAAYRDALAAIDADDLMRARAITTAAIHLAWTASRRNEVDTIPRLQALLRRIGDLELRSEPLVVGEHFAEVARACESYCVAGCCGTRAFDPGCTEAWVRESGRDAATAALTELNSLLASLTVREAEGNVRVLWSDIFEEALTAGAWRTYLATWVPPLRAGDEHAR